MTGYEKNLFRFSLPKAMSISRKKIIKRPENEKVMEGHRSSMGGHRRLVEGYWRSLRFFLRKSDF